MHGSAMVIYMVNRKTSLKFYFNTPKKNDFIYFNWAFNITFYISSLIL